MLKGSFTLRRSQGERRKSPEHENCPLCWFSTGSEPMHLYGLRNVSQLKSRPEGQRLSSMYSKSPQMSKYVQAIMIRAAIQLSLPSTSV